MIERVKGALQKKKDLQTDVPKCAKVSNFKIETSSWFKSQRSNEDGQSGGRARWQQACKTKYSVAAKPPFKFMKQVNELSAVISYSLTLQFLETFVGTELEIIIFKRKYT